MSKNRALDIGLGLLIVGAIGFIGYRVMAPKSAGNGSDGGTESSGGEKIAVVSTGALAPGPQVVTRAPFGQRPQAAFAKQKKMDSSAWRSLTDKYKLDQLPKTKKCQSLETSSAVGNPQDGAYQVLSKLLRERLVENGGGIVARYGGKRCHSVNQELQFVYFGESPDEPYVSEMGSYKIESIVEFDRMKMPPQFWEDLGLDPKEVTSISNPFPDTTLLKVVKQGGPSGRISGIPEHFRYQRLVEADLDGALFKKAVAAGAVAVLDIRTEAKQKEYPFDDALVFDFAVRNANGKELTGFNWDVRVSEIEKVAIPNEKILTAVARQSGGQSLLLVIGESEFDPRPFWLLHILSGLELQNVRWYGGDPKKLKTALK